LKSAVFDIESSALEGIGAGLLICACVRPLSTNRTRTFRLDTYKYDPSPEFGVFDRQERDLLADLVDELKAYDLLIGHNITGFDLGFLRTRAFRHNIPFPLRPVVYDTMQGFRRVKVRTIMNGFGKPSAGMAMVADLLGIRQEKTAIYPVEWWQSLWGNDVERADAMNNIVDHCQKDVRMNAQIYEMLLPLDERLVLKRWV